MSNNTVTSTVTNNINNTGDTTMTNFDFGFEMNTTSNEVVMNEFTFASTVVPMLFVDMFFEEYAVGETDLTKQLVSAAMFKTLFNMRDGVIEHHDLDIELRTNLEYMVARNRDQTKTWSATEFKLTMIPFLVKIKMLDEVFTNMYTVSKKFIELITPVAPTAPLLEGEDRRMPYTKGISVMSDMGVEAFDFLKETGFNANQRMLDVINKVSTLGDFKQIQDAGNTIAGSNAMKPELTYYTEIHGDERHRMYNAAYFGPNIQSSDINRSLYELAYQSNVVYGSDVYLFIMEELKGACSKMETFFKESTIVYVSNNPTQSLVKILKDYPLFKAPFTYVRMCMELADIINNGNGLFTLPIGIDAKCSGTQIYGIITGTRSLMSATGFCSVNNKAPDPYQMTSNMMLKMGITMTRECCKKPYMVVQYGGGERALLKDKALMETMDESLIKPFIQAVETVLGSKVVKLREMVQARVKEICEERNVPYFAYTHIDGSVVEKPVCGKIDVTQNYSAIRYQQVKGTLSFGSYVKGTGIVGISDRVLNASEFARTFMVNYIQGLDALIARTVAVKAKAANIKGYCSIHDCFLSSADDVMKLKGIINEAYIDIFVNNNPLNHLGEQLGLDFVAEGIESNITVEDIIQEDNYYFCQ